MNSVHQDEEYDALANFPSKLWTDFRSLYYKYKIDAHKEWVCIFSCRNCTEHLLEWLASETEQLFIFNKDERSLAKHFLWHCKKKSFCTGQGFDGAELPHIAKKYYLFKYDKVPLTVEANM